MLDDRVNLLQFLQTWLITWMSRARMEKSIPFPWKCMQRPAYPRPPTFSGASTPKQSEANFYSWRKFVIRSLKDNSDHPLSMVWNSLRDQALDQVEDCTSITKIVQHLSELYAPVQDKDKLLSQFYSLQQHRHECIVKSVWECYLRSISIKREITELDASIAKQLDGSLRHVFWEGLHCVKLKATFHYKYNSVCSTEELMKALVHDEEASQKSSAASTCERHVQPSNWQGAEERSAVSGNFWALSAVRQGWT